MHKSAVRQVRSLIIGMRPGDWATLFLGTGLVVIAGLWRPDSGVPEKVVVRAGGSVVAELDPRLNRQIEVSGPLGVTVFEVAAGRARVLRDPSPRQRCVQQGWLGSAGEFAVCLPNQVSLELQGRRQMYDSVVY